MRNLLFISLALLFTGCTSSEKDMKSIVFLHHSTGYAVWVGKTNKYMYKLTRKGDVQKFFEIYNKQHKTFYQINELVFPKSSPYGWNNYPFDYYNIWAKNPGEKPYMEEPTLDILTRQYDVIVFKHCFPVSRIQPDTGKPNINSEVKSLENYKLQYNALKNKMHEFTDTKFIVWTPAVNTKNGMTEEEAIRTRQFHDWMVNTWDEKGDNIFCWDFYKMETEGGLFLAEKNAEGPENAHPNREFSAKAAPLLGQFIIDVIEGRTE
jgi:hypothetical protein